jgi:hypothetical protein
MIDLTEPGTVQSTVPGSDNLYPAVIHRLDGFMAAHSCAFDALEAALPTDELHPLRLPNGRAILVFALFQKRAVTGGTGAAARALPPYAELLIGAMVSPRRLSRAAAMRALAGIGRPPGIGQFPLHMPLTDRWWRDGGRAAMGVPMFVADFDLDLGSREWALRVSEAGEEIATIAVTPGGLLMTRRDAHYSYGTADGRLWAAPGRTSLLVQYRQGGTTLSLGSGHEVASELRRLQVSPHAFATYVLRSGRAVMGAPVPIGAGRERRTHEGLDVPLGRYTVRYPGTQPIDQHARPDWGIDGADRAEL